MSAENGKSLGFTLGVLAIVAMVWYFVLGQSYNGPTGIDLLQLWQFVDGGNNGYVYLGLFTWALVLGFLVIPFATFASNQKSLISILGASFDMGMDNVSKLGNDAPDSSGGGVTQEARNALILSFLIYTFLIVGILTVLFFFMNTFGSKFLQAFSGQMLSQGDGGGGLISGISFFWEAIKNLLWAYAGLIFLSFIMNIINKNVVEKNMSDGKVSGIEFLKSILLVLCVIGISYWVVNVLDMSKGTKDIGNVIGIGVQGGTVDNGGGTDGGGNTSDIPTLQ